MIIAPATINTAPQAILKVTFSKSLRKRLLSKTEKSGVVLTSGAMTETSPKFKAAKFKNWATNETKAALPKKGKLFLSTLIRWSLPVDTRKRKRRIQEVELPIAAPKIGSERISSPPRRRF